MSVKKIVLTEDMLSLISNITFEKLSFEGKNEHYSWGIDSYGIYGGTFLLEDISRLIGKYDEHIKGTEEDISGVKFSNELTQYMYELHDYIIENMIYIESLVHYYTNKGGLTPGTYICKNNSMIWSKK